METKKIIEIPKKESNKTVAIQKEKKCRVITQTDKWVLKTEHYNPETQFEILTNKNTDDPIYQMILSQIQQKINGYKSQDNEKKLYSPNIFVDLTHVLYILCESNMTCYYCKKMTKILYEHVREPSQWTLERIDNDYGHNKNNVVISCLSCNLSRRCMYHERYLFTKQLNIVKK
jgi:hypothetical protein